MSLRLRLFLAVTLVIVVHTGARIVLLAQEARNSARLVQQVQGEWVTKSLANILTNPLIANDLATVQSTVELLFSEQTFLKLAVLDDRGRTIIDLRPGAGKIKTEVPGWFATFLNIVAEPSVRSIDIGGVTYGKIETIISPDSIVKLVWHEAQTVAWVAIVEMTILSLLLWTLMEVGLRPLKQLSLIVQRIGAGEFGAHLTRIGSREFNELICVVNDMSQKLQALYLERKQAEQYILKLNLELEQRVVERTLQLQDANKQLEHQTLHDALTRLPNRVLFHDRLRSTLLTAHRTHDPFALVEVDLDLFKEINDTLGHQAGDLVLQHVADACNRTLRDSDTVARMGGDEFAILLPKVTDIDEAIKVVERVLEAIRAPLKIDGREVHVNASMGIAMFPEHGDEATELFNHSDAAMYVAKQKKLGIVVYRREMGEGNTETAALKADLRHAINAHELLLYFQPKIDINSKTIVGVEALLRWEHPRMGMLFPDTFIVLAETSGLIKQLTQEVLRLAMQQINTWRVEGISLPVAVNISAVNLQDADFPDTVAAIIAEHQVPSHMLELEVTETAIMTEPLRAIENIRKLSDMGVLVSIDDFGTGYSSLAYLQKLMVAKIKIDKSFVMEMATGELDEVIVRSTIDLAHNMGLIAVAEGVETQEAWDKLREMGCDSAQGYFMSKPLPPDKLMAWINESEWSGKLPEAS